jgi:hypothetical protein
VLQLVTANHTTGVGPGDSDISGQISHLTISSRSRPCR